MLEFQNQTMGVIFGNTMPLTAWHIYAWCKYNSYANSHEKPYSYGT